MVTLTLPAWRLKVGVGSWDTFLSPFTEGLFVLLAGGNGCTFVLHCTCTAIIIHASWRALGLFHVPTLRRPSSEPNLRSGTLRLRQRLVNKQRDWSAQLRM